MSAVAFNDYNNMAQNVPEVSMSRLLKACGAMALSVGLFGGLFYWGYSISTLDPQKIPVIKKVEGPARVAPEDPGGEVASHMGLSVNEVQSSGSAGETAMRVVLAPKPTGLTAEDVAGLQLVRNDAPEEPVTHLASASATEEINIVSVKPTPVLSAEDLEKLASAKPSSPQEPVTEPLLADLPAPADMLRPLARPQKLEVRVTEAVKHSAPEPLNDVAAGTKLVQLGAFDKAEVAKSEWNKLMTKHGDLLRGKTQLVQLANSGGRKFYRLRAVGFKNADASRALCSALIARGTPCIPVTAR